MFFFVLSIDHRRRSIELHCGFHIPFDVGEERKKSRLTWKSAFGIQIAITLTHIQLWCGRFWNPRVLSRYAFILPKRGFHLANSIRTRMTWKHNRASIWLLSMICVLFSFPSPEKSEAYFGYIDEWRTKHHLNHKTFAHIA